MCSDADPESAGLVLIPETSEWFFADPENWRGTSPCQAIAKLDEGLRAGSRYPAYRPHRLHLEECPACWASFPRVVREYDRLDTEALETLRALFYQLPTALRYDRARVEQLGRETLYMDETDFDCQEDFQEALDAHIDEVDRLLSWQAALLAKHVGRLMEL